MIIPQIPIILKRPTISGGGGGGVSSFTTFTELWPTNAAALPAAWTVHTGSTTPQQLNIAGTGWYDANGGTNYAYRDAGGQKGVIEFPLGAGTEGIQGNTWADVGFCADAGLTHYNYLIMRADTHVIQYNEYNATVISNSVSGTTDLTGIWAGVRITIGAAGALTVELNTGAGYFTELSLTMVTNFNTAGQTYMYISSDAGTPNALFGKVLVGP